MPEQMSSLQMMMEAARRKQAGAGGPPQPIEEPPLEYTWANLPRKMQEDITNHPAGPEAMMFNFLRTLGKQHEQDTGTWKAAFGSLRGSRDRAFAGIEGLGNTARRRAGEEYEQDIGTAEQDLTGRGLYSSTLLDSSRTRASGKRARRNTEIDESVGAQRADLERTFGGALSGMVAQRPNKYTAQGNIYASLLQAKSQPKGSQGFPWGPALGAAGTVAGSIFGAPWFGALTGAAGGAAGGMRA